MATQLPLTLIRNGFTIPGGFDLGPLPIIFGVDQNQAADKAVLVLVHERARRVTIQLEGTSGRVSFVAQTLGADLVEPWFPLSADGLHSFDVSDVAMSATPSLKQFFVSFDSAPITPARRLSGLAEP